MTSSTLEFEEEQTEQASEPTDRWLYTRQHDPLFLEAITKRIDDLEALEPNWDGYGAPALGPDLIAAARSVAERLAAHGVPRPYVVPLSTGALQFEWRDEDNKVLELEIERQETIHYLRWDPARNVQDEDCIAVSDDDALRWLTRWFMQTVRLDGNER